jgi:AraC-like DNA-binding protein
MAAVIADLAFSAKPYYNPTHMALLDQAIVDSLAFSLHAGEVTTIIPPHSTGWRVLPGLMCSQLQQGRDEMRLDNRIIPVPEGALMLLPAGVHHRIDLVTSAGRSRWIHGLFTILGSLDVFALVEVPPVIPPSRLADQVGDTIEAWHQQRPLDPLGRAAADRAMAFRVLELLSTVLRLRPEVDHRMESFRVLKPVLDSMEAHPDQALSCTRMASLAGLRPRTFHRAFHDATGATPAQYLRNLRIRQAQRMLIGTRLGVAEIALRCGWLDPFVFSRAFRSACGQSPRDYRLATSDLSGNG